MADKQNPVSFDEWASAGGGVSPVKTGLGARAGDIGLSLLSGAVAVPEAAVGLADMVTGGKAGKAAEALGLRPKEAKALLADQKSAAAKDAQWRFDNAEGFTGKVGAAIENPSLIANAVAESAPLMVGGGFVGRGVAALAPRLSGAAGAIGEGVVGAGSAAEQIRQETADGELTGKQAALAGASGVATGLLGMGGKYVGGKLGVGDIDQAIATGSTKVAGQVGKEAPGMLKRVGGGALAEGVLEELPQSMSEQALQNIALDKPFTQDLDSAAAMGLVTGGAMGAGMGVMTSHDAPPPAGQPVPPAATPPTAQPPKADGPDFGMVPPTTLDKRALYAAGNLNVGPLRNSYTEASADWKAAGKQGDVIRVGDGFQFVGNGTPELAAWKEEVAGKTIPEAQVEAPAPAAQAPVAPAPAAPALGESLTGAPVADMLDTRTPSQRMGLNPAIGGLTAAAALAVDSGASPAAQAFGIRRRTADFTDVTPITAAAGQIETPRRLGESPVIDVQAREVKDQQSITSQQPRVGMTPRIGNDSPTQGALNGPQAQKTFTSEPRSEEAPAASVSSSAPTAEQRARNLATLKGRMMAGRKPADQATTGADAPTAGAAPVATSPATPLQPVATPANDGALTNEGTTQAEQSLDDQIKAVNDKLASGAPVAEQKAGGFDSVAWDKSRDDTIKESKKAGNKHLDDLPKYVESMRGEKVYYAHDPKVTGTVRTVDNTGAVYIDWADEYSASRESASPVVEGKKTVMRSMLGSTDLRDYVVGTPVAAEDATRPITVKESPANKARRTDAGYTQVVRVNAQKLTDAYNAGNPVISVADNPSKISALAKNTNNFKKPVDGYPLVTFQNGAVGYEDGRHRVAAAIQRGGFIEVAMRKSEADEALRAGADWLETGRQNSKAVATNAIQTSVKGQKDSEKLPPTDIRSGDKLTRNGRTYTVTGPIESDGKKGVVAETADESLGSGVSTKEVRFFFGDDAIRAKIEADKAGLNKPAKPTQDDAPSDVGQQWTRSATADREGMAVRAGLTPKAAQNLAKRGWGMIDPVARDNIERGLNKADEKAASAPKAEPETVPSEFTGKPDPRNSQPMQELDGFKVGDMVDIPGRTTGLVKIETLYKRTLAGLGPTPVARVMRDNGKTLDVALSELKAVPAQAPDLNAMFDDVLDEEMAKDDAKKPVAAQAEPEDDTMADPEMAAYERGRTAKTRATDKARVAKPRTAGQATASAAKNTASALGNAIDALGALFGQSPNDDGTINLNSGIPVKFNAETYDKAKPLFQAAVANLGDAGRDMKEAMRAVVRMVMDKFGTQAAQNMKPYVVKFIEETSQGNLDTTTSQADTGTKENGNERTEVRGDGPQALGGMAAGEDRGAEGGGPLAGRNGRSGEAGTNGGGIADERGVPTARSGGGGAEAVYSADTGAAGRGRRGGRGGAGAEGSGGGVSGNDARPSGNRRQVRAGVPAGGRRGAEATDGAIPATNFRITPDLRLGQGGEVQKFKDNVAAIEVLKRIEAENRRATAEEQSILARYVGWGGLANAFPDPISGDFKDKWQERGEMLRELLTKDEYANARRSTQDAHYTSEAVVSAMWGMARKLGFKGGLTLENSMGSGNFVGLMPEGLTAKFVGVEQDSLTARLAQALYPQATVLRSGLQSVPLSDNTFALNIGNPPFGSKSLRFQFKPEYAGKSIHNQFFLAGLDALRPGGLQVKVVSRYLMDAQDKSARLAMAKKAKLVGLFRLPDNAFRENARTDVVTDIVVFQKLTEAEQAEMEAAVTAYTQGKQKNADAEAERAANAAKVPYWVETAQVPDPLGGEAMVVNAHFKRNPGDVLGVLERSGSMARGSDITVRLDDASQLAGLLERATARLPADIHSLSAEVVAATEARFKSMSDALRIALAKEEEGHLKIDADGKVQRVIERDTPEGDFELARQEITPDSPWSEQLRQDADGKWYRMEVVTGEDGKPVKEVASSGKVTKRNVYQREVFANEADIPASLRLGQTGYERLVGIVKLRDLLKRQLELETADAPKLAMEGNRKKLATAYADFVAKHGPVNRSTNNRLANTMPDGGLVQALEVAYQPERTKEQAKRSGLEAQAEMAKPAPILKERVVPKYEPATKAASAADALAITLAETGRVDIDRIAQLLDVDGNKAADMLQDGETPLAFTDPETSTWETANNYLSGMVKRKLNAAKQAGLEKNVAALEKVQPEPWTAENVTVQMGSTWVPPDVYADFIKHLTGGKATVGFSSLTNSFTVDAKSGPNSGNWGTGRMGVGEIVSRLLNSQAMVVRDTFSDGSSKINQEETSLAGLKAREVSAEFMDWVFQDGERRARLVEIFNDKFNTRVNRQYDGSHMMLPGKVPDTIIAMRRHQMNAIWRGIYERFMLVDHAVGAGKTFTAIARAMERRRMGLSRKPMIVVPNHLVEQWAADVYRLYPGAKVLAAGKKDFEAKRRRRLFGKVATGDWDIVIVPHSSFGQIGISPETESRFLEQEMELAKQAVADAWEQAKEDGTDSGFKKPFGVKEAERLSDKIQERMDKLNSGAKDRLLTFEQLGVDDLTVDEAHEFKNLYYSSRLTGVRGMGNKTGSKKANDLYNKVRVLRETPTGSVAFLTGTPISNSAVEMFTVMRYLAADSLRESGMEHFDAWRAQYVEATPAFEPTESGRLKEVTRLGRTWSNMRSLMDLYYQFTDAVSLDDIKKWFAEDNKGKAFPVPKVKGGGDRKLIAIPPTPAQEEELKAVMAGFDGLDDIKDTMERNAARLRLMDRARKLSLDIRAVNPRAASKEEGGKLERVSQEVKRIYDQWTDDKGTQLIFLDRSVPKSKGDDAVLKEYDALVAKRDVALRANDEEGVQSALDSLEKFDSNEMAELRAAQAGGWNAYQQIKDNLVAMGIPANEIRFIQEATNDEQKLAMFDAVNGGKVRVLIGSTPRMGAGTNVQQRAVALHHVDVTWKPSDIEQREGRVIRQGNSLLEKYGDKFEVEIMAYATERTVDAKMWDLNATKLRTINGIRNYDGAFSMEFEDEEAVGMAEMAALASGNPMLLERVKLESELNNLELMQKAHSRKMFGIRDARDAAKRAIERNPGLIAQAREVSDFITERLDAVEARHAKRSVSVEGVKHTSPADALIAAKNEITRQQEGNDKARYAININGQRVTNKADLEDAIAAAMGDSSPFEALVAGKTLKERTVFAREVAAMVNPALTALPSEGAKNLEVGEMLGYKLTAELTRYIDRGNGMSEVSLTLFDADGRSVASETANRQPAMASYTTSMLWPAVDKLWSSVKRKASTANAEYLERQMQRAIEELPTLEVRVNEGFPKAAEMAEKRARLANVVSTLSGKGQPDDGEAPAASRTRPVFSRAAQGQASNVVQGIVDTITARWGNAPKVVVAFDMDDPAIPERVRAEDQKQRSGGATGTPEGFYYKGVVYLMSSKLANPRDVVRVLFHEALGHYGLRGVFGKELKPLLQQIATMRKAQIEAKMKEYGLRGVSNMDRLVAAEEILAEMAQDSPSIGFVRRAVATIRAWLRKHVPGFGKMVLTDDEIISQFILPARNFALNGGPNGGPGGGVRFSKASADQTQTPAFKKWFGDSKVVDADGKPLVVYRADATDITKFDKRKARDGFFFHESEAAAKAYGGTPRAFYLNITNPLLMKSALPNERNASDVKGTEFDGVINERSDGREFIAIKPTQVKSAIGNNGNFDPANPDIRFSRSAGNTSSTGAQDAFSVKDATADQLAHYRGMGMQALGRRQIVDLYGDMLPELKQYDQLVQRMEADKNESGAEADALVNDWAKLDERSLMGVAKHPGMERKLAELMHDSTLAQIDPDKPLQKGDDAAAHKALADRFNALSPKAQEAYRTARDMYANHFKKVQAAIKDRIQRSAMDGATKAKMIAKMDADLFNKLKGVYFPLARFGKYVVVSKNAAGETVSVSRAETLAEANKMRREVVKNSEPGVTVSRVYKDAEFNASRDAVGKGFVADLLSMLQGQGVGEDVLDSVGQLYLSSLPDLSWAKHGIHRKGTPGFSQDARRAFAQNMFHGARHLAKLRYSDQLADKLMDMEERVKDQRDDEGFDPIKAQQVVDEMNARHENLMNPKTSSLSTALTSIGFVWFLGISPASAMVNLSQTALVAYPVMAAKWGFQKAGTALLSASAEVVRAGNDLSKVLKGEELAAFQKAVDDGTIDVTQAHDLAGVAQGEDERVAMAMRPVMRAASFMFHHAEKFNRQATFIAAYRLAKESGAAPDVAFEQAKKATYDGHFDYGAANRPRIMQGNWQKVLFLFKQYGQNMVYTLSRQAYLSMKGMTPEQRTEARKQLGGLLAMHAMAAGALGLPLVGALLSAASMLGGDDDEPWDAEVALKNAMADAMGPKAAEVMAHGLSRLTPWDLSGRVALNKLILPDIQEGIEGQPLWEKIVMAAAGPVASIGGGFFKGVADMGQGQYQRGLESMLPVALRNPVKAMRFAEEGAVDKTGVVIKDEVGLAGLIGQASGFRPSEVALATEGRSAIYQADRALTERRGNLVRQYALSRMNDDSDGVKDALEQVRQFNEKNPNRRITMPNLMQSVRNRQRRIDDAEQGVYLPNNRRDALEAGRFALAE